MLCDERYLQTERLTEGLLDQAIMCPAGWPQVCGHVARTAGGSPCSVLLQHFSEHCALVQCCSRRGTADTFMCVGVGGDLALDGKPGHAMQNTASCNTEGHHDHSRTLWSLAIAHMLSAYLL